MVLVDPDAEFTLAATDLFYRNKHSAYVGAHFVGRIQRTISRGCRVFVEGRIVGSAGHGPAFEREWSAGRSASAPLEPYSLVLCVTSSGVRRSPTCCLRQLMPLVRRLGNHQAY